MKKEKSKIISDEDQLLINIKKLLIEIQNNNLRLSSEQNELLHQYYNQYFKTNESNGTCYSCVNKLYTKLILLISEKGI